MVLTCALHRKRGFSLLETFVVVAVLAVVVALGAAVASRMLEAMADTTGADMIVDTLTEARADAVAQNMTVEVRIYALVPPGGASPVYNALQLHWVKPDKTTPGAASPVLLPPGTAIDATAAHSTLIATNPQIPPADAGDMRLNSGTRVFHFLPDGSTDLNPAANWFLTVRSANASDPAHFPANWACVAIDATTGRAQIYRP